MSCDLYTIISARSCSTTYRKRKYMKPLSCRKCEGHGGYALLKGHAPVCPYNDCTCESCGNVMALRANALIRRFRRRRPGQPNVTLRTIRSKNGNLRLRVLPKTTTNISLSEQSKDLNNNIIIDDVKTKQSFDMFKSTSINHNDIPLNYHQHSIDNTFVEKLFAQSHPIINNNTVDINDQRFQLFLAQVRSLELQMILFN